MNADDFDASGGDHNGGAQRSVNGKSRFDLPIPRDTGWRSTVDGGTERAGEPELSVIVPMRNEAENVPLLLERLGRAVAPLCAEILIADDS